VDCTVLERRAGRSQESRATGLQARTLELLAMRGIVDRFLARGYPHDHYRVSLGSARIDLRRLNTNYQQLNICPQCTTEELLEQRARELGAVIQRRTEVIGVHEKDDGVLVTVRGDDGESVRRADWVVGFDGSHSIVRESADIGFPGKSYPYNVFVADVRLGAPPADGMLIEVSRHGLVVAIDYGDGWWRLGCVDHEPQRPPREPVTLRETRETVERIFGRDLQPYDMRWG
jgi:2-polyprenyl-6-methoxyphenol hydroxylase-like FAD-dependent oxidoreductase